MSEHDESIRIAYIAMQRALIVWEVFGDFIAAADYYTARRKWLALKEKQ